MEQKFTSKHFNVKYDYLLLASWFKQRHFPSPNPRFLPPTGLIVSYDSCPVAAGFLFKTDAKVASIAHLISDNIVQKSIRARAVNNVITELTKTAKECGFEMVTVASNIPQLDLRFTLLGFEKTDEDVSHYRRILCPSQD